MPSTGPNLGELIAKRRKRRDDAKRDYRRALKAHDRLRDRREDGEEGLTPEIREHAKLLEKRQQDFKQAKDSLDEARKRKIVDDFAITAGPEHWGGCEDIIDEVIVPILIAAGTYRNSGKRSACYGNCSSDHHISQTTASACDAPVANAYALRDRIMRALGVTGPISDYANYTITYKGYRYRVQPIAGTHGTGPHLHIGLRYLGRA